MRKLFFLAFFSIHSLLSAQTLQTPDKVYGRLFHDVQMSGVFSDGKTFVDCVPKRPPADIVRDYLKIINNPAIRFSLELFIQANFDIPAAQVSIYSSNEKD